MEHFSEPFKRVEEKNVPGHVATAVAELAGAGYEVEILEPPDYFVLNGPVLRMKVGVRLPSRPRHGIGREEFLLLGNWETYPASPPSVRFDRVDFPRSLPHINQTRKSSPVWPCLTTESLSSWFQGRTVVDLVARVEMWLADAASGRLMRQDERTFEPVFMPPEREHLLDGEIRIGPPGYCVASARLIVGDIESATGSEEFVGVLRARYLPLHPRGRPFPPVVSFDRVLAEDESWDTAADRFDFFGAVRSGVHTTQVLPGLVVALAETDAHFGPPPDEVPEFEGWCQEMGLPEPLRDRIAGCFAAWQAVDLVPVTFLIPRPRPLAGNPTGIPNMDCVTVVLDGSGAVIPTLNLAPLDRRALARYSGSDAELPRTLLVGAGALGSKLGTHLVRTVVIEMDVVDPDVFVEHNLARHDLRRAHVGLPKSEALIDELVRMTRDFTGTPHFMTLQEAIWRKRISPSDYGLVIDATASPGMPFVLSYFEELPRVFSVFTVPGGELAVATIEGPKRNPRADDLEAAAYALAADREDVRKWLEIRFEEYVGVGGCRDISAVITDDVVSFHAARFSRILRTDAFGEPAGAIWIHGASGAFVPRAGGALRSHQERGLVGAHRSLGS